MRFVKPNHREKTRLNFRIEGELTFMQTTILAPGSRGDVQPYGLEFFAMGDNMQAVAQELQGLLEQGNFLKILSSMGGDQRLVSQASKSTGAPALHRTRDGVPQVQRTCALRG